MRGVNRYVPSDHGGRSFFEQDVVVGLHDYL